MKKLIAISVLLFLSFSVFSQVETEESNNSDTLEFKKLDVAPDFPGGDKARLKYIMENIYYPEIARESGIQGTVHATFIIEKDGSITNVRILRGIGGGCDKEVIRLIEEMPDWIPGSIDGENVRAQFNMPIKFTLNGVSRIYDNQELDKPARFPNGTNAFNKYLKENMEYPKKAVKKNIQGVIKTYFKVSKTGNVYDIVIAEGFDDKKCNKAVVKFLENMPDWENAQYKGEDVISRVEMIFVFKIKNNKAEITIANNNIDADKSEEDEDPIFVFLEEAPEYVGGEEAMKKFIQENTIYPKEAKENGKQGTVYITFVVEKDGSLTNIKVIRGIGYGCDEEALRVIKSMPKWKPGKQRGNVVRAQFNIPVKFVLEK